MFRSSHKFSVFLFSNPGKKLLLFLTAFCILGTTFFVAYKLKRERLQETKIFVSHHLNIQSKSSVLPSNKILFQLEKHINDSSEKINCDFSALSGLFFLKGNKEKGCLYAKKAYDESLKIFPRSELFDSLFSMTYLKEPNDSIDIFEAVHDLFMFLETNYPEDKYPLLRTLVLMKLTLISRQFHAKAFEEHYKNKLTNSQKFDDLIQLFSEGKCSLQTFINKSSETCKHA